MSEVPSRGTSDVAVSHSKAFFTEGERQVLERSFAIAAQDPTILEELAAKRDKSQVDTLSMAFASLCEASSTFHQAWMTLMGPALAGERSPSIFCTAMLQNYLLLQGNEWAHMMLAPFFSHLVAGKMKRKRAMKEADLLEAFEIVVELMTSEDALNALPRNVRALAGLLWSTARSLGMERAQQVEIVADFFFLRLVYPVLLVPDQFGLVEAGRPLKPLAKQILQGVTKVLSATIYQMDMSPTPFAFMMPSSKDKRSAIEAFCTKLATDPDGLGWSDYFEFPADIAVAMHHGDSGLGLWLSLLLDYHGDSGGKHEAFEAVMQECKVVGSELERRRAIARVISEEQEFTLRVDGVTFWLRELDYGVMMEGTALRMANEWLKKVNQLRAVLRIGLNKRCHVSQWNGCIADLIEDADWSVFFEFGKILRSNLAIVANSVDVSLERAVQAYKRDTSRDPLRDLVALLVHGRSLITRIGRLPPALDAAEQTRLDAAIEQASAFMVEEVSTDCSEMVRLHQMQTAIVAGWTNFPEDLLEQSGMVRPGRLQVQYGKLVGASHSIRQAKYAMLLSDALVLLEVVDNSSGDKSSARDREQQFGGGNAFAMAAPAETPKKGKEERDKSKRSGDVSFRLVKAINLNGANLRLRPATNSFQITTKANVTYDIAVASAVKLDWITAWSKIDGLETKQSTPVATPRRGGSPGASPRSPSRGTPRTPRSQETTPRSEPVVEVAADEEDDDLDEMDALMALGMYDTAVIVKTDAVANEDDNAFASMVGGMKRRDGKERISLADLFVPPPGLVVKEWQQSLRMMKHQDTMQSPEATSPEATSPRNEDNTAVVPKASDEESERAQSEEAQLRAMLANYKCTMRLFRGEK